MSLIELVIYVALLSTFLIGSIFSAYSMLVSVSHDDGVIDQKLESSNIQNNQQNGGFVAIISAVIISTTLILLAVMVSGKTASYYDLVMRSEYRLVVKARTYACLDRVLLKLSQDYFYAPVYYNDRYISSIDCFVDSVSSSVATTRIVSVSVLYKGIHGRLTAEVTVGSNSIQILHKDFILF